MRLENALSTSVEILWVCVRLLVVVVIGMALLSGTFLGLFTIPLIMLSVALGALRLYEMYRARQARRAAAGQH